MNAEADLLRAALEEREQQLLLQRRQIEELTRERDEAVLVLLFLFCWRGWFKRS